MNNSKNKVDEFCNELDKILDNIKGKNPYINIDLNAKHTAWWGDVSNYPVEAILGIITLHGFHEIINQPTHFYPGVGGGGGGGGGRPSCIDLIFCSQPNLISESGVLPFVILQSHHHIIFAKANLNIKLPPHTDELCEIIKMLMLQILETAFFLSIGRELFVTIT